MLVPRWSALQTPPPVDICAPNFMVQHDKPRRQRKRERSRETHRGFPNPASIRFSPGLHTVYPTLSISPLSWSRMKRMKTKLFTLLFTAVHLHFAASSRADGDYTAHEWGTFT